MDLIIKNLDHLRNYHNGHNVPIGKVVLDFDKLGKDDFTQIFFDACEKYAEVGESYLVHNKDIIWRMSLERKCINCKHCELDSTQEPCRSCWKSIENRSNWEPKEPVKSCGSCKYQTPGIIEPCGSCITMGKDNYYPYYEPAEPNLKEVTERMQSEFDATGKDVKIFMNERVIKK